MALLALHSSIRRLLKAERLLPFRHTVILGTGVCFVLLGMGLFRDRGGRQGDFGEKVHLSFDDGADEAVTATLLATLAYYHVPASFFEVGSHLAQLPDHGRKLLA